MTASDASDGSGIPATEAVPAASLDEAVRRVGDRWSLLLVNALLAGPRRFNELLADVPGLAPNVLSARLRHLESTQVVVAEPYSRRPPRFSYRLSARGAELAGALRLLAQWGSSATPSGEGLRHDLCGSTLEARWYCPTCDVVVEPGGPVGGGPDDIRFV